MNDYMHNVAMKCSEYMKSFGGLAVYLAIDFSLLLSYLVDALLKSGTHHQL
jgi:hypothetical protein